MVTLTGQTREDIDFEDDLDFLLNDVGPTNEAITTKKTLSSMIPSMKSQAHSAIRTFSRKKGRQFQLNENTGTNDILKDLKDLKISNEDKVSTKRSSRRREHSAEARRGEFIQLTTLGLGEVNDSNPPERSQVTKEQLKQKNKMKKKPPTIDIEDKEGNKTWLTAKRRKQYCFLESEFNIKCQTRQELLVKVRELHINTLIEEKKLASADEDKSLPLDPPVPLEPKKRSISLITNNPKYYNKHTERSFSIVDLTRLPYTDEVVKTAISTASPISKKLMCILLENTSFFNEERSKYTSFWEISMKIALESPNYFSNEECSIIPQLQNHKSRIYRLVSQFQQEQLDIDTLSLLGHILLWWNFHSATKKKTFFKIHHFKNFNENTIHAKLGGLHLWHIRSYQNVHIDDTHWETLEEMRVKYRYEEEQFYIVIGLMNLFI